MTERTKYQEYLICKERGHQSSGVVLDSFPPWSVCKNCGTGYRFSEPQLIEINRPAPDEPA